jgi:hypothetical protein
MLYDDQISLTKQSYIKKKSSFYRNHDRNILFISKRIKTNYKQKYEY